MRQDWIKIIIGEKPLPNDMQERAALLQFADQQHVLGQMAVAWSGKVEGKTLSVMTNGFCRADFDHQMLKFEMNRVERALLGSGIKPVLLKGAAYVAGERQAGKGRRVSDIDILVREDDLAEVEKLLKNAEWEFDQATSNEYDQRYYRQYMHELPPLRHMRRQTVVDVHHHLLPKTSRININIDPFFEESKIVKGEIFNIFNELDMFIHSSVHTFVDGTFDTPVRSLIELQYLLSDVSVDLNDKLLSRIHEVRADMPTALAFWMLARVFDNERAKLLYDQCGYKTSSIARWAFVKRFEEPGEAKLAKLALYIRSHYLRMPLLQLLGHFAVKLFRRAKHRVSPSKPLDL